MRRLKGEGVGKNSAIGKLNFIKVPKKSQGETDGKEYFERCAGIAVSKIDECLEYLCGRVSEEILSDFRYMSEALKKRSFFISVCEEHSRGAELEAVIEKYIKLSTDTVANEAYILLIGVIRGCDCDAYIEPMEISVCDFEADIGYTVSLAKRGVAGAVFAGEAREEMKKLLKVLEIPAVFVPSESLEDIRGGECAMVCPEKDTLLISPDIDVIDEFMSRIKASTEDGICAREDIFCVENAQSGDICGFATDISEGEELSFARYRSAVEYIGDRELIVSFPRLISKERIEEQIRAICRAAVYGKISLAVVALGKKDYINIRDSFDSVCRELSREGREFQDKVEIGVIVDGLDGMIFAARTMEHFDFCLIDTRASERMLSDKEKKVFQMESLEMLLKRIPKNNKKIKKRLDK